MISERVFEKNDIQRRSFRDIWQTVDNPEEFLGYRIEVRLKKDETGGFVSYVAQLRGVVSEGEDAASAMRNAIEAFQACIETYAQEQMQIPWSEPEPRQQNEDAFVVTVK